MPKTGTAKDETFLPLHSSLPVAIAMSLCKALHQGFRFPEGLGGSLIEGVIHTAAWVLTAFADAAILPRLPAQNSPVCSAWCLSARDVRLAHELH